ncbi:MAG TPA: mercury methylation corrinoid protein HgcA [Smithella sp.]|nr:mercury methylation corrinoid protein HgcA [Smithella sp.]
MDKFELPIINGQTACGCNTAAASSDKAVPGLNQSFICGFVDTKAGWLPKVSSELKREDYWGSIKARWGVGRMDYKVDPGLYALGTPDDKSPVFVSANYKMSFDRLRSALKGRSCWILVLDTKGINVWCAAGKGTFGTEELVRRIESSGLKNIVSHRKLILPQLGAPGVSAHQVKKISGFNVQYGPILAEDLEAYLDAGFKATGPMRLKTFPLKERAVLIPIELVESLKTYLILAAAFFIASGFIGPAGFRANAAGFGLFAVLALLAAIIGGAVINPLLLPYLPGRAFSIKGFSAGIAVALILLYLRHINLSAWPGRMEAAAWCLIIPAISGYLALNFTGCSTYTSISGVKKEMRWALPLMIACGGVGVVMWIGALWIA